MLGHPLHARFARAHTVGGARSCMPSRAARAPRARPACAFALVLACARTLARRARVPLARPGAPARPPHAPPMPMLRARDALDPSRRLPKIRATGCSTMRAPLQFFRPRRAPTPHATLLAARARCFAASHAARGGGRGDDGRGPRAWRGQRQTRTWRAVAASLCGAAACAAPHSKLGWSSPILLTPMCHGRWPGSGTNMREAKAVPGAGAPRRTPRQQRQLAEQRGAAMATPPRPIVAWLTACNRMATC